MAPLKISLSLLILAAHAGAINTTSRGPIAPRPAPVAAVPGLPGTRAGAGLPGAFVAGQREIALPAAQQSAQGQGETVSTTPEAAQLPAASIDRGIEAIESSAEGAVVGRRFRELNAAFGDKGDAALQAAAPEGGSAPAPLAAAEKALDKPITVFDAKLGMTRHLSYDPAKPGEPLYKAAWRFIADLPNRVRRIAAFRRRVKEEAELITDEQLWWSINRLKILEAQEGILRTDNRELVNPWPKAGDNVRKVTPADFEGSSIEPVSVMKIFKRAMDLEEPTLQYQYAFAQNLHNRLHRMSHFLGLTMQEHILAVALKNKAPQRSIWAIEEVRHGPILERAYNLSREPGTPPLVQEGEAPRLPRDDARYLVLSGMSNRSLAEISAASAYLTLRANAKKDSPVDLALDGLYRDEVYHYVIMSMVNKFVFGQGRLQRLYRIIRHDFDYNPGMPTDVVIHRRKHMSPLAALEVVYSFLTLDKRIDRFMKKHLDAKKAADLIGPTYVEDHELAASLKAGEQTKTAPFRMEVNPHLTGEQVDKLSKRFPGLFVPEERNIKASQIRAVIQTYRDTLLKNPDYWMRRKGFEKVAPNILQRKLGKAPEAGAITLVFPAQGGSPSVSIAGSPAVSVNGKAYGSLDSLSMLQIGALFDAEDESVVAKLETLKTDLTPEEIMKKVAKDPPPIIND